jgi:flagellar protein FliS
LLIIKKTTNAIFSTRWEANHMAPDSLKAYRKSATKTNENKEIILIKLLNGAINFIDYAKKGILQNTPEIKGKYISKTMAIVIELDAALNRGIKNKIVNNLSYLYQFVLTCLSNANIKNKIEDLENAEKVLIDIKEGFISAAKKIKTETYNIETQKKNESAGRLKVAI